MQNNRAPGPLPDSQAAVFFTGFLFLSLTLDMTKLKWTHLTKSKEPDTEQWQTPFSPSKTRSMYTVIAASTGLLRSVDIWNLRYISRTEMFFWIHAGVETSKRYGSLCSVKVKVRKQHLCCTHCDCACPCLILKFVTKALTYFKNILLSATWHDCSYLNYNAEYRDISLCTP
jgi:hypothetical protein